MSDDPSAALDSDATVAERYTVEDGSPSSEPPPLPERLGRYRVLERVGFGGMGIVELAHDPELDRRVALKWLRRSTAEDAQRILREARAVAQISHPNVVAVHDVGVEDGTIYIAMEYVEGPDLRRWLAADQRSLAELLDVLAQAGEGLGAAHRAGLIHRDFKPSNVLVGTDGRVRVLDFGLAKASEGVVWSDGAPVPSSGSLGGTAADPITRDGAVMGTPLYMAPEQHLSSAVDHRADIYAFCLVLYEGLAGKRAFSASSIGALVSLKRRGGFPRLEVGPRRLRTLVHRGLDPDPTKRPASMDEVVRVLRRVARPPWTLVAAGAAGGLGVAALAWAVGPTATSQCDQHQRAFDGIWDDDARARQTAEFEATQVSFASAMARRTADALDDYVTRWIDQRIALCEGKLTAPALDNPRGRLAAEVCMESRREEVARAVELLSVADVATMARALKLVRGLPSVAACVELPGLVDGEVIEVVLRHLADARIQMVSGNFAAAESILRRARADAASGDYLAGRLDADVQLGSLLLVLDQADEARALLEEAALEAETSGDDRRASRAYVELAYAVGVLGNDFEGARRWLELAQSKQRRAFGHDRRDPDIVLRLIEYRAIVEQRAGNYAAAELILRDGLDTVLGFEEHAQEGRWTLMSNLGNVVLDQGRADEAIELLQTALAHAERLMGEGHPMVAETRANLAAALSRAGRYDEAIAVFETELSALEAAFGAQHPTLVGSLSNLGSAYRQVGRMADARAALTRAEILSAGDERVSDVAMAVQVNLAGLELEEGKPRLARERIDRVVERVAATWGDTHPHMIRVRLKQAEVMSQLGAPEDAVRALDSAIELLDQRYDPSHPLRGTALVMRGEALLALGRPAEAVAALESALELLDRGSDREMVAEVERRLQAARRASRATPR